MKKNFEKVANILYVSIIVVILGLAIAIDKTNSFVCKCILPVCFIILIATLVVKYFSEKANLAIEVNDESYAVINDQKYSINIEKGKDNNVNIKLVKKN